MAFTVQLRTEGDVVVEQFVVATLPIDHVPALDDESSAVLRFIDPYQNTMLNAAQAAALVAELKDAVYTDHDGATRLSAMAARCASAVHQYLWFIGD